MARKTLEHLASKVNYEALPANWNTFDLARFSPAKRLWDYQEQALRLAISVLFKYYEEFDDFTPGQDGGADKVRKSKLTEWYRDGMFLTDREHKALNLSLNRTKLPLRILVAEYFSFDEEEPFLSFEQICNRMSFWMATGSGKTLVLVKLLELLHLLMRRAEVPICDVLMLTHREDLIDQFVRTVAEFNAAPDVSLHIELRELREYSEAKRETPGGLLGADSTLRVFYYRSDRAEECYCQALRSDPNHALAHVNRSFGRLLQGDLLGGWLDFEHRFGLPNKTVRSFREPRWDGSSLAGKTILIHAEQGLGDTLQFIRYARLVKERGGRVVLECQPSLVRLLEGVAGVDQIVPRGEPGKTGAQTVQLPDFDVHIPLLSLPGVFGTTLSTVPTEVPYLRADPALVERWGCELAALDGFKIGIVWQGNPQNAQDRQRSVPWSYFERLARLAGIRLVSLQKGPGTEQLAPGIGNLPDRSRDAGEIASPSHFRPILDFGDRLDATGAFLDTSALMMSLDLVVTVDTAVAHLAGALGVPAWVLLTFVPDWRWLLERCDSPWYPTLRLFRQRQKGDWGEVFERIAAEIRAEKQKARAPTSIETENAAE